jgi:RNA polymerase I-specific transcription initiation factor RRN3
VSQAAFYIICFRGIEAVKFFREKSSEYEEPAQIDLSAERWTRLGGHALQPLRYCLESVRSEFLAISKAVHLVDPDVLEGLLIENKNMATARLRKKRVSMIRTPATLEKERQSGGVGGLGQGTNPLDSFFPFDPYLLRRSNNFVEPFYGHWKGPVVSDVESDEDNDEEMDAETVASEDLLDNGDDDDNDDSSSQNSDSVNNNRQNFGGDPMSLGSQGPAPFLMTDRSMSVNTVEAKREALQAAWAEEHKRSRAYSIENGSW